MNEPAGERRSLLTVALEDYFHVGAFHSVIPPQRWSRFEMRLERNTLRALDLLDRFRIQATFFVLGWVAEERPDLVREVARRGHEIADRGYYHRAIRDQTRSEFRDDLRRSRAAIERAVGVRPLGFRAAHRSLQPDDLWALDVLAEEGYAYDSSLLPAGRVPQTEAWRRFIHRHRGPAGDLWEVPLSSWRAFGCCIPIAGGNYMRQLPPWVVGWAVERWHRTHAEPFVMYFHVWELDPDQPRIQTASALARLRHYRNLDRMGDRLERYFARYRFGTIAQHLRLPSAPTPGGRPAAVPRATGPSTGLRQIPVTVVVPCFNEQAGLGYLANTLREVDARLGSRYALSYVFVDDGSHDDTWRILQSLFAHRPGCTLVRHDENRGVMAAILTGIRAADTEVVCSIDADCTYDPCELGDMIPLLADDVALVTGSPYHPAGRVRGVPRWRLALSRTASALYRHVLGQPLHTYTSCFRVYRRSAVVNLELGEPGFLGVAEVVGRLALEGRRLAEHPTALEARVLGRSKMKTLRAIGGHLRLLARLGAMRARRGIGFRSNTLLPSSPVPAVTRPPGRSGR